MKQRDARELLAPALGPDPGPSWADLGAGRGTFTRALAELLGSGGVVLALDRDPASVRALQRLAGQASRDSDRARIVPAEGDLRRLDAVSEPGRTAPEGFDGILLANVLHFFRDPDTVLSDLANRLRSAGRVVVIEYEGRSPSPWVPHPLPADRLRRVATAAGLAPPRVVARRESAYRGSMYCAALEREGSAPAGR